MSRTCRAMAGWALLLAGSVLACRDQARDSAGATGWTRPGEHETLAGSFVGGDSAALRRILHPDFIVQPPEPDSAKQGEHAIAYLIGLASATLVDDSRLEPRALVPEGPFAFEQGVWHLQKGDQELRSSYVLRWRNTADGWKVVLWRWGPFR
ncbi:MAG TPA: DUF4440 domain-containing protein [Gemmatimonadales bacterium]|nr:DUF4440 domain-containing protein [Gemmatimonadales bacterium]